MPCDGWIGASVGGKRMHPRGEAYANGDGGEDGIVAPEASLNGGRIGADDETDSNTDGWYVMKR